jgi:hypothetical protein
MTQSRWLTLIAVLVAGTAQAGNTPRRLTESLAAPSGHSKHKLVKKIYPVAALLAGQHSVDPELLVRTITHTVRPRSWDGQGGSGTIVYQAETRTLTVTQSSFVHEEIRSILKTIVALYGEQRTPAAVIQTTYTTPVATCVHLEPKRPTPDHLKQYGHFVLDNVKVNAMGVSCIIKRIRFMYKGDGIDADVAKCALTNGESEKKTVEAPKALTDLLEKLDKSCGGLKALPASPAPVCVPASGCVPALPCEAVPVCVPQVPVSETKPCLVPVPLRVCPAPPSSVPQPVREEREFDTKDKKREMPKAKPWS